MLSPEYPCGLAAAGKKLYLAGGVVAAFECKLTLRHNHIREAFETSRVITDGVPKRWGSPYRELHRPIVYGLLAHSHEWKSAESQPLENIDKGLSTMLSALDDPRKMVDILCVSDVGTWTATKSLPSGHHEFDEHNRIIWKTAAHRSVHAGYLHRHQSCHLATQIPFTNVGVMVVDLWTRLGREQPDLRPIADYFHSVPGLAGDGRGSGRRWPLGDLLSQPVEDELARLDSEAPQIPPLVTGTENKADFWSEWHLTFTW